MVSLAGLVQLDPATAPARGTSVWRSLAATSSRRRGLTPALAVTLHSSGAPFPGDCEGSRRVVLVGSFSSLIVTAAFPKSAAADVADQYVGEQKTGANLVRFAHTLVFSLPTGSGQRRPPAVSSLTCVSYLGWLGCSPSLSLLTSAGHVGFYPCLNLTGILQRAGKLGIILLIADVVVGVVLGKSALDIFNQERSNGGWKEQLADKILRSSSSNKNNTGFPVQKTPEEWKSELSREEFRILRLKVGQLSALTVSPMSSDVPTHMRMRLCPMPGNRAANDRGVQQGFPGFWLLQVCCLQCPAVLCASEV